MVERLEDKVQIKFKNDKDLEKASRVLSQEKVYFGLRGDKRFLVSYGTKEYLEKNYGIKTGKGKIIPGDTLSLEERKKIRQQNLEDNKRAMEKLAAGCSLGKNRHYRIGGSC